MWKAVLAVVVLVGLGDILALGGWRVVLGYTIIGITVISLIVRAVRHPKGAQHNSSVRPAVLVARPEAAALV